MVRSWRSCGAITRNDIGKEIEDRRQLITFFPYLAQCCGKERHISLFAANATLTRGMRDPPDREYLNELLERCSSADVSEPFVNDKEEAIAPISASYARSI